MKHRRKVKGDHSPNGLATKNQKYLFCTRTTILAK